MCFQGKTGDFHGKRNLSKAITTKTFPWAFLYSSPDNSRIVWERIISCLLFLLLGCPVGLYFWPLSKLGYWARLLFVLTWCCFYVLQHLSNDPQEYKTEKISVASFLQDHGKCTGCVVQFILLQTKGCFSIYNKSPQGWMVSWYAGAMMLAEILQTDKGSKPKSLNALPTSVVCERWAAPPPFFWRDQIWQCLTSLFSKNLPDGRLWWEEMLIIKCRTIRSGEPCHACMCGSNTPES